MSRSGSGLLGNIFPILLMAGIFITVDGLALLLTRPLEVAGASAFENPNDPMNLVSFFLTMLLFTGFILVISKFRRRAVHGIFLGVVGLFFLSFFYFLSVTIIPELWSIGFSIAATVSLVVTLIKYPEWYVVDASAIIMGAGSIAMFGISLSIPLVVILLIVMAVYDAISVYKTKHMIDLADAALESRVPNMFIIPKTRGYSRIEEKKGLKDKLNGDEERKAFYVGLGDVVFPGVLFASTFYNISGNGLLIASSVTAGTFLGFVALMRAVVKGKPQAGLPYLSSGAILGYVVSSYLVFGRLAGFTLI